MIYNKFKQYGWYETITYNSKIMKLFSKTLEIRSPKISGAT